MATSRPKLLAELRRLHHERRRLLALLTKDHELAVGTVSVVQRVCGNPACHCASGKDKHPQTLFLFKDEQGVRRCKLIRRADEPRLHLAGQRYREFRRAIRELRAIESRVQRILMALKERRALHYE